MSWPGLFWAPCDLKIARRQVSCGSERDSVGGSWPLWRPPARLKTQGTPEQNGGKNLIITHMTKSFDTEDQRFLIETYSESLHFVRKITYDNKFMYYKFWFFNIKVFLEQWKDRDFPFFTLLYSTTLYFNTLLAFLPKTHYPHWYILLWSINMILCTWLSYFYLSFLCSVLKFSMLCTWFFCLSRRTFDIFPYGIPSWTTSASVQSGGRLLMWTTREGPLGEFCSSFTCNNKESCYKTIYQIQSPSPTKPKS